KVVLVTGSSKGIGAAIAKYVAREGAKVVVNYSGSQTDAEQVVAAIRSDGGDAIAIKADGRRSAEADMLFAKAIAHVGRVDVLVNNAGVMVTKPIKDTTDEDFDRQFDINVKGVFNTLRKATTDLADNGTIINLSTSVNRLMVPTYGTYTATKSAVEQMTRVLSKEIGRGINVNSVSPGPTNTALFVNGKPQEVIDRLAAMNPF